MMMEEETLPSVPIGLPISNCDVVLTESDVETSNQGEIVVSGLCNAYGFFPKSQPLYSKYVKLQRSSLPSNAGDCNSTIYFRTGDYAKRVKTGDLVFLGRKDRTIKINAQRIALEEVELALLEHENVADAAVVFCEVQEKRPVLEAFVVLQAKVNSSENFISSIRSWMLHKLPLAMIPNRFICVNSLPKTTSGKVNYPLLGDSRMITIHPLKEVIDAETSNLLLLIKKVCLPAFLCLLSLCLLADGNLNAYISVS